MRVVRLAKRNHADLSGKGAAVQGGRWNSVGHAMAYTASCGALAVVEYLVHVTTLPTSLVLMLIEIPGTLKIEHVSQTPLDINASRQIGDEWLESKATPVLSVPSVLVPRQRNYLVNPVHPLFEAIQVIETSPFAFDSRLISDFPPAP